MSPGTLLASLAEMIGTETTAVSAGESSVVDAVTVPGRTERALTRMVRHVADHVGDGVEHAIDLCPTVRERHVVLELRGQEPLLPAADRGLIENGHETALQHATELTVAQAYLVLTSIGGGLSIPVDDPAGRTLRIELPRVGVAETPGT